MKKMMILVLALVGCGPTVLVDEPTPECIPTTCETFQKHGVECGTFDDGCGTDITCWCKQGLSCDNSKYICE